MKPLIFILIVMATLQFRGLSQGVAVNTDGSVAGASAMLDVQSTSKGILVPRMTSDQRTAISSPAQGLIVYQTDHVPGFYYYNGTAWREEMDVVNSAGSVTSAKLVTFDGTNWVAKSLLVNTSGSGQPASIVQPFLTLNYYIACYGVYPSQAGADPYIGEIQLAGFYYAPMDFLACNGQLIPIAEFDVLFNLIGTTYGGDGQTTFGVPDLRGRVALHQGQGSGMSNKVLGQVAGTENVYLTTNNIPAHTHTVVYQ